MAMVEYVALALLESLFDHPGLVTPIGLIPTRIPQEQIAIWRFLF
jgi:hypothetical protein